MKRILIVVLAVLAAAAGSLDAAQSTWVYYGLDGKLNYQIWSNGNRIMDFSHAGYMGGGVALPNVATVQTINPSGGDDKTALQNAINSVSALPLVNGFRGALQLGPGTFLVSGQLNVSASGVVIRGSGSGPGGTIVRMTSGSTMTLFNMTGSGSPSQSGAVNITNSYVPSGTNSFNVSSAAGYSVGDTVIINRTVTSNWVHYLNMDTLVRDGATQTWISVGTKITTDRTIKSISNNVITLDVPLTDSFDSVYLGNPVGTMAHYTWSGRISQVGIEHLRIEAPAVATSYISIHMNNLIDSWARDIVIQDGVNCFTLDKNTKRCTIEEVIITHTVPSTAAAGPSDFACSGTQIFYNKCQALGTGSWPFVTHTVGTGPIVVLNFFSTQHAGISPHQRWCTGLLSDTCSLPNAPSGTQGIAYRNRGTAGSGHGWTTGWSVAWNVTTPYFLVSAAPGSENWCIGGVGTKTSRAGNGDPDGIYDSLGVHVDLGETDSLYLEQLRERLGNQALANIGYASLLSVTPAAATVASGGTNVSYVVTVSTNAGFSGAVTLGVSGLPTGATAGFVPAMLTNSGSSTMTVTTTGSTPLGSSTLTIRATNGVQVISASAILVVAPNFDLSVAPDAQTVLPGNATNFTVTVTTNAPFTGTVNLGISGLPANTTAGFSPTSVSGTANSTLTVTTAGNTPLGSYTLTIFGTNGTDVASTTALLVVGSGPAGVVTWNGGSVDDSDWNDPDNWGGTTLLPNAVLIFAGNNRLENNNDTQPFTLYSNMIFNAGAGAFVLDGNPITVGGNITNNSSNPQTINLGLQFSTNFVFSGTSGPLILGGGLTNTLGAPGFTTLTLAGTGIITNLLGVTSNPGGTNILALRSSTANWSLMDNPSSLPMTVPWILSISNGTFNVGNAGSAPVLTITTGNGQPVDNQIGMVSGAVGTLNMVNGTLTTSARLNTATSAGATGIVNQVGGTLNIRDQFQGANGSGAGEVSLVNVSGGMMNVTNGNSFFYVASRGSGTLTISGSGVVNAGKLDISRNASGNTISSIGIVNLNGGVLMVTSVTNISANQQTGGSPTATFNFNGGTLQAKAGAASMFFRGCPVTPITPINAIVKSGGAIIDDGGNAITMAEPLQHDGTLGGTADGGLTKNGAGTLTLTANNTYTGNTTVNAGTLALNGIAAFGSSPRVSIGSGATLDVTGRSGAALAFGNGQTLSGNGVFRGDATIGSGAKLTPGSSIGTLTFSNALALNVGSTTVMEVTHLALAKDFVDVTGTLTYGGTLIVTNVGVAPLAAGDSFQLFEAGAYAGSFSSIILPTLNNGLAWSTVNLTNNGSVAVVTVLPLTLQGIWLANGSAVLTGAGGSAGGTYHVLSSTNVASPANQWSDVGTNQFDIDGKFNFTNTPDPSAPQIFYRLRTGQD